MLRVYNGARADGTVVATKVTNAIDNYKAAIACFVRSLPSLQDPKSSELVRAEIKRLMARLGELQGVLREVDPAAAAERDSENDAQNRELLADLKFKVGDEVWVDEDGKRGKIIGVDFENGAYAIQYKDGTKEMDVAEARVRIPGPELLVSDTTASSSAVVDNTDAEEQERVEAFERHRLWSEIVESERTYRDALKMLVEAYIIPLDNPIMWGGAKAKKDTVFSQKTLTTSERAMIFGNVEDLAGTSTLLYDALSERFEQYNADQRLADVVLSFESLFQGYAIYAKAYFSSQDFLRQCREERNSFEAIMDFARMQGAPPLEELMRLPLDRPGEIKRLLALLAQRTRENHPDAKAINDAYLMMGRIERAIALALNYVENQKVMAKIEKTFSPEVKLSNGKRVFLKYQEDLHRIEGSTRTARCVWLFSDIIVVGRKSEWFNVGNFRHIDQLTIEKARSAPEFGPFAFEVSGKKTSFVFVAFDYENKQEWLNALRAFLDSSKKKKRRLTVVTPTAAAHAAAQAAKAPLDFMPGEGTGGSLLGPATLKQKEIRVQTKIGGVPASSYRTAKAMYAFTPQAPGDLEFSKGDTLFVYADPSSAEGWAVAQLADKKGNIPLNYLSFA